MSVINIAMLLLLIVMTWFGAFGGYFLKKATAFDLRTERAAFLSRLALGVGFYGCGAILNIVALQFLPYTVVFPLTAVTYIWTMIISFTALNERIGFRQIAGVLLIVAGAVLLVS